jgi:hypothetical protein
MKKYNDFIKEEIAIRGNSGIPGEAGDNNPKYLNDVDNKGREEIRNANPRQLFDEIMRLAGRSTRFKVGKEKELEAFAEEIIRNAYSGILDDVDLDIKFVRNGKECEEFMEDEDPDMPTPPKMSMDKNLRMEVDKRKIANNITQGEAKNTKMIIEMPECKEGLQRILGERDGAEYHQILVDISRIANKLDWIIPVDAKADMMENAPEGMAGAVVTQYKPKKKKEEEEKPKEEKPKEEEDEYEEETESFTPTIKARGVDFAMLIHETVKGIYELIASGGIPEDEKLAGNVMLNTSSFMDEAEDFKYGPYIAADLRDFINKNPNIDRYPNIRENVYGKLIKMPAEEFLKHMKNILLNSEEGRKIVDQLVDEFIEEMDEYEQEMKGFDSRQRLAEIEKEAEKNYKDEDDGFPPTSEEGEEEHNVNLLGEKKPDGPVDYSTMSQKEIQIEIDNALDNSDYERVGMLSKYLKEGMSKQVYLKELERINEKRVRK